MFQPGVQSPDLWVSDPGLRWPVGDRRNRYPTFSGQLDHSGSDGRIDDIVGGRPRSPCARPLLPQSGEIVW